MYDSLSGTALQVNSKGSQSSFIFYMVFCICLYILYDDSQIPDFLLRATWSISHTWKPDMWKEVTGIYWYFDSSAQEMGPAEPSLEPKPNQVFINKSLLATFSANIIIVEMTKLHICHQPNVTYKHWDNIGIFLFHIFPSFQTNPIEMPSKLKVNPVLFPTERLGYGWWYRKTGNKQTSTSLPGILQFWS